MKKTNWRLDNKGQLYIDGKHIPLPYDIAYRTRDEPKVYQYQDKLVVVLSTVKRNGILLPKEQHPQRGEKDFACNAYCLDAKGNTLWRNEALRKINFCTGLGVYKGQPFLKFDHDQGVYVNIETGKLLRETDDPPAPVW